MGPARAARRAMYLAGAATAALLAAAAGSCGGNAFTIGSGDGGSEAGGGEEAGGPLESGSPDVEAEGGGTEGSVPSDGASAGDVVDAGPGEAGTGYCPTHPSHTFCEDFDSYANVDGLLGAWTTFQQSGGSFHFNTTNALSPPNALAVTGSSGAQILVVKTLSFGAQATSLRLEFDLRFNTSPSVGLLSAVGLAAIAFGRTVNDGYAALAVGSGPVLSGAWVDRADAGPSDAGSFKTSNASGGFPTVGVWAARYAIVVDYTGGTGCEQIFQGTTPLLASCLPLPPDFAHPAEVSIVLGDYAAGFANTGVIDVEFDNVTFDVK